MRENGGICVFTGVGWPYAMDVGCLVFGVEFTYALSIRDIGFGGGWS
jgi:hypothetical protein